MGLSDKKEERLKRMPNVESVFSKSKDGKYLIHRTIITTVRPVEYFEKVLSDGESESPQAISGEELASSQTE